MAAVVNSNFPYNLKIFTFYQSNLGHIIFLHFSDFKSVPSLPDQRFMAQNLGGTVQVGEEAPHCGTQTTNFAK